MKSLVRGDLNVSRRPEVRKILREVNLGNKNSLGYKNALGKCCGDKNPAKRPEVRKLISDNNPMKNPIWRRKAAMNHRPNNSGGRGQRHHYQSPLQGQVCLRSSWELAYAKYLDSIGELWMYEMETFELTDSFYTPDFFLPRLETFVEIKGWMDKDSKLKIQQFKSEYTFDLEVLQQEELESLGIDLSIH